MKVLPEKEFRKLVIAQKFSCPESTTGVIDKKTYEAVVPVKASTRIKLHELGHEKLKHFPTVVKFYGKGKKDVMKILEPWTSQVDDEIEAEIYSFKMMDKTLTPMVGMQALYMLISRGYDPLKAFSLVMGRLHKFDIPATYEDRIKITKILEKGWDIKIDA